MSCKRLVSLLVLTFAVFGASFFAVAQGEGNNANTPNDANKPVVAEATAGKTENNKLDVAKVIFGHIA